MRVAWGAWLAVAALYGQAAQNPSPMVETTREHGRVAKTEVMGRRSGRALHIGKVSRRAPVVIHFHGAGWIAEKAAAEAFKNVSVAAVQIGSGSGVYGEAMKEPAAFAALLTEAEAGERPVYLTAFSAGYGAVRAILRHSAGRVSGVLLMDGLHAGYETGARPGPVVGEDLDAFLEYAREAGQGKGRLLITHSEVFPGTFASTTETADWLVEKLGLRRKAVLRWGPGGMQQLSEIRKGRLLLLGFAGNSAPDHVDHLHGMRRWLALLRRL